MLFSQCNSFHRPKIIAHRGATVFAPENSLPAFEYAGRLGIWAIETDIRKTRDNIPVCCHDPAIDDVFDGGGAIAEMTYSQLLKFKIVKGNGVGRFPDDQLRIPTFKQYLRICRMWGSVAFIELKTDMVEGAIAAIREMGMEEYCVLSSVQFNLIEAARSAAKGIFIHHIFSSEDFADKLSELGYAGMSLNYPNLEDVPDGLVERIHERGVRICFRAADTARTMIEAIKMGSDYVPTNCVYQLKPPRASRPVRTRP